MDGVEVSDGVIFNSCESVQKFHLMKESPWLVDANKWCDNKVDTYNVHCALKPLHGSQQRTQIVASVKSGMYENHANAL